MSGPIHLRDGDSLLAIVTRNEVLAHTRDIALSHAEFVRRSTGTLPEGAWVGTIRKADGEVIAFNSRTFYGNQLPASNEVAMVVRSTFQ